MPKALLTGGAGYIGSHTAAAMISAGWNVVIADALFNSSEECVRRVEEITGASIPFYKADVCDGSAMEQVFSEHSFDAVVHFAGFKCVPESVAKPVMYYRNNIDSTLTLLEKMEKYGVHTLVYSSSATVYGFPGTVKFDETLPLGPVNPYGWTKQMCEQILRDACAADSEMSVVLLRYFNPVGAHESGRIGEDPSGIPNNLMPYISRVAVGVLDHLNIYGSDYNTPDGTGVRDYIHVMDLAEGHLAALEYAVGHKGTETFNLGRGKGVSVLEMVETFQKVNEVPVHYVMAPRRSGDLDEYYADPSKAQRVLGWKAARGIEEMCRDTWRWQSANPDGYGK